MKTDPIANQIADHAYQIGLDDEKAERREECREIVLSRLCKKIRFCLATRDLRQIELIFESHNRCFKSWISDQLADTFSPLCHEVYEKVILGIGRDQSDDIAHKMASVLDIDDDIEKEMRCNPAEF